MRRDKDLKRRESKNVLTKRVREGNRNPSLQKRESPERVTVIGFSERGHRKRVIEAEKEKKK